MLVSVKTNLKLPRTSETLKALKRPQGFVLSALNEAAGIYKNFILSRFDKFSRGGGDWRNIKPETAERKKSSAILVDTRTMRLGLAADIGAVSVNGLKMTIRIKQRTKHKRAKMSVAKLASIHHFGLGRVPARKILVRPDARTNRQISDKVQRGIKRQMKGR